MNDTSHKLGQLNKRIAPPNKNEAPTNVGCHKGRVLADTLATQCSAMAAGTKESPPTVPLSSLFVALIVRSRAGHWDRSLVGKNSCPVHSCKTLRHGAPLGALGLVIP